MNNIHFDVPGKPEGKARAQTFRNKYTGKSHGVTPDNTALYENLIKMQCLDAMKKYKAEKIKGPVEMCILAYFNPLKKLINTKTKEKAFYESDPLPHPITKPDADNIAKVVKDALNGIMYDDDKQVVRLMVEKFHIKPGYGNERLEIHIVEIKS